MSYIINNLPAIVPTLVIVLFLGATGLYYFDRLRGDADG